MPLPAPILDDRSYQQLRDELIRRIPVYAPEWTDHNASDPGITLLELFAFLGENLLYRFNQIPESTRLAFLRLLRIPLRPATPARTLIEVTTSAPGGELVPIGSEARAGALPFETADEVRAWPVTVRAVARAAAPAPATPEAAAYAAAAIDARGGLTADEEAAYYRTLLVPADPEAPDALPVDFAAAVDGMVWVAVLGEAGATTAALGGAVLNIGIVPDEDVVGMADVDPCPGEGALARRSPATIWEASTDELRGGEPVFTRVEVVGDTSSGLTRPGVVRLQLPADTSGLGAFASIADPDLPGTGALPPVLDDDDLAARLLFWLRAYRRDGERSFGRLVWVGANATAVVQVKRAGAEFLGTGTGQPDQRATLINQPVIDGTLVLQVEEADGWTTWREVDGFHASGEADRDYVLDRESGEVRFGNGVQGRTPQIGQRLRAREYRYGGGPAGNVPAGAIAKLDGFPSLKTNNPLPARGGAPAESVEAALERVPGEVRRRDRAVTAGDFRELALATPGADIGRAECLPVFHPPTRQTEAAGVVSVVVWPREDRKRPGAPMPDRTMLRTVCSWLDARRLVTTELYVVPPTYRRIAVAVGLRAQPGFGIEAVRRWVELVIRQYVAPLPPYGPGGQGWPLGRRVHGPELEAAALQVEGVEYLEGLGVAGWDDAGGRWVPGTVVLEPYEVPELVELTVVEGAPMDPGVALSPPASPRVPVPIPVMREEC
jgi:hypothetical protein